jgi:uncharacterized protein YhbP (UPF0306 family)
MTLRNTKLMPQQELETHIAEFLTQNNMCTLATCSNDVPRATPIEYHSKGLTLYLAGEPGTKLKNITANPDVSIGIYFPYTGMESVRGAQLTGEATIIAKGTKEFDEGLVAYQWEKTAKEFNLQQFPVMLNLIKIEPVKIELTDMFLKKKGYSPRQTLIVSKQ